MNPNWYLLPHERRFGNFVLKRQQTLPDTPGSLRFQQGYGPDGIRLTGAGLVDVIPAGVIGLTGATMHAFSHAGGILVLLYCLIGIGLASAFLSIARFLQAGYAGRVFRNGRPFPGRWD
jgi:hypothetical protein